MLFSISGVETFIKMKKIDFKRAASNDFFICDSSLYFTQKQNKSIL